LKARNRVPGLMSLMMLIMYLDRVCISVSGPRMQDELHITPMQWGWVVGIFELSYALFEIPRGILGDRLGPRRVITRIVLWWSAFTTVTGMATGFAPLPAIRFLFGMGEAGAYPNSGVVVARWFPLRERGRAFGVTLMASQPGGELAPLVVVPIQVHYGWRHILSVRDRWHHLERVLVLVQNRIDARKKMYGRVPSAWNRKQVPLSIRHNPR
jgi:ACS family glucarate transporter-like MFS transporter